MNEFIEKLIERLEKNTIYDKKTIAFMNKYGRGIGFISKNKAIEIVNQLAEEYKDKVMIDGQYCFQTCVCTEMCDKCNRLCNGDTDYYESFDSLKDEYNNDFCEWFKYDYRTITPKYHDAENPYWRIPDNMDKLKFCPYCGKKIKIAPYQPKGE